MVSRHEYVDLVVAVINRLFSEGISSLITIYKKHSEGALLYFQVCATTPCMLRGAETITETIEKNLGTLACFYPFAFLRSSLFAQIVIMKLLRCVRGLFM